MHCFDQPRRVVVVLELAAQPADLHVDRAVEGGCVGGGLLL
jgi:hypothetical protein